MDDLDAELLGLAEGSAKRSKGSKSRSSKATKRKRPAPEDSASDMDMSASDSDTAPPTRKLKVTYEDDADGDDDDDDDEEEDLMYPLEGKYENEADRQRILAMTELEREEILGERAERLGKQHEKRELRRMVRAKERAEGGDDGVRGTGRERKTTGTTIEKRETLEKLKKQRAEKGKKKERKDEDDYEAPARKRRDDYTDEESDGEVEALTRAPRSKKATKEADVVGPSDLRDITVTRTKLVAFSGAPWFSDWIKGAWVRLSLGFDKETNQYTYRLCQVENVKDDLSRPYKADNVTTTVQLELRHGKSTRYFTIDVISNSPMTDREFVRLSTDLANDSMTLPTIKEAHKIKAKLDGRTEYVLTEADLSARLAKKGNFTNAVQGKAKLLIRLSHARSTNDVEQEAALVAELAKLESPMSLNKGDSEADRMKRVNERNRATNREEIKKAEARGADERRKQAAALARGDVDVHVDPSARVKTLTRLTYDREPSSRPATPTPGTPKSGFNTPPIGLADISKPKASKFSEVAKAVDLDLDLDF